MFRGNRSRDPGQNVPGPNVQRQQEQGSSAKRSSTSCCAAAGSGIQGKTFQSLMLSGNRSRDPGQNVPVPNVERQQEQGSRAKRPSSKCSEATGAGIQGKTFQSLMLRGNRSRNPGQNVPVPNVERQQEQGSRAKRPSPKC